MRIDLTLVIYALVFLGALLAFEGIRQLLFGHRDPDEVASRRMRMYREGASPTQVLEQLRRSPTKSIRLAFLKNLDTALGRAGLTMKLSSFLALCGAGAVLVFLVASSFVGPALGAAISIAAAVLTPQMVLNRIADQRAKKLVEQLPDALDTMARGLKIGHPLNITLANVTRETPDPLGTELGIVVDQIAYGDDLVTAIRDMADRLEIEDVSFFAVAVGIQHGTGGNLSRILGMLGKVIRDRAMMRRRIRAISSEGRMTMIFMTFLPPGLAAIMMVVSPGFFGDVAGDPLFVPAMGIVASLIIMNFFALRKLVNFRI